MPLAWALASAAASSRAVRNISSRDGRRARANLFAERVAVHELAGDVEFAVDLLERVDGADAGMGQRRGGARFAAQPLALRRIARQVRRQRLERHRPSQPRVDAR